MNSLNVDGSTVECVDSVRDLGVWMQNNLSFDTHIKKKCQLANYQLLKLKKIRKYLSQKSTEILVHGLVCSHFDFCNSLLIGQPACQIKKLQRVQNRAARLIMNAKFDESALPLLFKLHWLPVEHRIKFKILVMIHKCVYGSAPKYLMELIQTQRPQYNLRRAISPLLTVPRVTNKLTERSFAVAGPMLWNELPAALRGTSDHRKFRGLIKTHLFKKAFS